MLARVRLLAFPVIAYLFSRAVVHLVAYVTTAQNGKSAYEQFHIAWDGAFYLTIAERGYVGGGPYPWEHTAFFPVMPLLIRCTMTMTGLSAGHSGMVVSFIGGLVATVLLWRMARSLFDERTADGVALLFVFFPGSIVFSMVYGEAVTIPLAIASLWSLHKKRWVLAGVTSCLAVATRPTALVLIACCVVAAAVAIWKQREWRALAAPALAPLGLLGYLFYLHHHVGDAFITFRVQERYWKQETDPLAVIDVFRELAEEGIRASYNHDVVTAGFLLLVATVGLAAVKRVALPPMLYLYTAGVMASVLISAPNLAKPRYLLTAFPLLIVAVRGVPQRYFGVLVGVFTGSLAAVTALVTMHLVTP